jgi:hypothetical protein
MIAGLTLASPKPAQGVVIHGKVVGERNFSRRTVGNRKFLTHVRVRVPP